MMDVSQLSHRATATTDLPGQGLSDMSSDPTLSGRMERRLPIIVVVRLAQAQKSGTDAEERTYTDNISPRGARLFSTRPWKPGDPVRIAPRDEDPVLGNVVYCQTLPDGRFVVGVNFQDRPITWSAMRRYDGLQTSLAAKSQSS
jgi:PilZ domain